MNKERLEFYLNRKNLFGYNTKKDESSIAWVILSKRFPKENFFERFTESDFPDVYKEQMKIKNEPYNVWVAELKRDVFEGDKFPVNDDYLVSEKYTFKTLDEAEIFLKSMDLSLSEIKWGEGYRVSLM